VPVTRISDEHSVRCFLYAERSEGEAI
jgi:hypothetical protein